MELNEVHKEILMLCAEDDIGLWDVIWRVNGGPYSLNEILPQDTRDKTVEIIHDLLQNGLIQAGFPRLPTSAQQMLDESALQKPHSLEHVMSVLKDNKAAWEPLSLSIADTIDYIQREWDALGHTPDIGDIVWFRATSTGKQLAHTLSH